MIMLIDIFAAFAQRQNQANTAYYSGQPVIEYATPRKYSCAYTKH